MKTAITTSKKQALFNVMLTGTLLYAVVLGFYDDYTDVFYTVSYSVTFAVAVVMQLLTYATFGVKDKVLAFFQSKKGTTKKVGSIFGVWLVIFLSKFVFLAVIDWLFNDVYISGFFGLLAMIVTVTILQLALDKVYKHLGEI